MLHRTATQRSYAPGIREFLNGYRVFIWSEIYFNVIDILLYVGDCTCIQEVLHGRRTTLMGLNIREQYRF